MTGLEGIVGLIASVFAILGGLFLAARYIGKRIDKRFDKWIETTVANTAAVTKLTVRVSALEETMKGNGK